MPAGYQLHERTADNAVRQAAEQSAIFPGVDVFVIFYAAGGSYSVRSGAGGFAEESVAYYADLVRRDGPDARAYLVHEGVATRFPAAG